MYFKILKKGKKMKILVYNENEKSRLVVGQLLKELSFNVI